MLTFRQYLDEASRSSIDKTKVQKVLEDLINDNDVIVDVSRNIITFGFKSVNKKIDSQFGGDYSLGSYWHKDSKFVDFVISKQQKIYDILKKNESKLLDELQLSTIKYMTNQLTLEHVSYAYTIEIKAGKVSNVYKARIARNSGALSRGTESGSIKTITLKATNDLEAYQEVASILAKGVSSIDPKKTDIRYFKNYLDDIDVGSGEDFCFWIKKGNSFIYDSGLSED